MSDRPTLDGINLVVRDIDATLAFYRALGVEIPDDAVWRTDSGAHHVEVEMPNGMRLDFDSPSLAAYYDGGSTHLDGGGVLGFSIATREAVDERYAALVSAGYQGVQPPFDAFWGARYAVVEDPSGNHVGLMSPSDPERRAAPPNL
jgi:catechol 2,3-dioxygenase-like lactoylglutathione lyase family enzyme